MMRPADLLQSIRRGKAPFQPASVQHTRSSHSSSRCAPRRSPTIAEPLLAAASQRINASASASAVASPAVTQTPTSQPVAAGSNGSSTHKGGVSGAAPTFQEAVARLQQYWSAQGCLVWLPHNTEVGAGTMNPATFLRVQVSVGTHTCRGTLRARYLLPGLNVSPSIPHQWQQQVSVRLLSSMGCAETSRHMGRHVGRVLCCHRLEMPHTACVC